MTSFWRVVNEVIRDADVILEVLDARFPNETRNKEIEEKIAKCKNKKLIFILNKSDLITERFSDRKFDFGPCVFVSAKENLGTTKLRGMLREFERQLPKEKKELLVGILGYPNTGKSSLINALKQKKSAGTGSTPGFTRGLQKIRISEGIYLLDTPGVFPFLQKDEVMDTMINVKDYRKVKDPEGVAFGILDKAYKKNPRIISDLYKVEAVEDNEETLLLIAKKYNWLVKGGKPNIDQTARKIIQDWQRGKLII